MRYGVYAEGRRDGWHCSGYIVKTGSLEDARAVYNDRIERDGAHELEWIRLLTLEDGTEAVAEVIEEWERFVFDDDRSLGFIGG